jgi:2-polyprenyl-3-methyl-5-hydroxy-6-metoxy-1,4-benzoquinol methylase
MVYARWNHNIHYHGVILEAISPSCRNVLEVGCGEGLLALDLSGVARQVTAIDRNAPTIQRAQTEAAATNISYILDDFMVHPFAPESFDAVVSIATIHHIGAGEALAKMRDLVRPGGTLAVVGLARSRCPGDLVFDIAGVVSTRIHRLAKPYWETNAPKVWPPPETYHQIRQVAEALLPGVCYRRRVLFRYSLVWAKPTSL